MSGKRGNAPGRRKTSVIPQGEESNRPPVTMTIIAPDLDQDYSHHYTVDMDAVKRAGTRKQSHILSITDKISKVKPTPQSTLQHISFNTNKCSS